jgi:hypothetical protein
MRTLVQPQSESARPQRIHRNSPRLLEKTSAFLCELGVALECSKQVTSVHSKADVPEVGVRCPLKKTRPLGARPERGDLSRNLAAP